MLIEKAGLALRATESLLRVVGIFPRALLNLCREHDSLDSPSEVPSWRAVES